MPPTRREQLELDELLSDIYRGIETLPDSNRIQLAPGSNIYSRTYTREYELPASSPLVKQHKQELAALREVNSFPTTLQQQRQQFHQADASGSSSGNTKKPQRSTLKRNTTPQQQQQQPQSLASFVTSTTPDNKRRVRIVDHPDKLAKDYSGSDDDKQQRQQHGKASKVKYVNTNKLIYHQEHNPDDYDEDENERDEENNNKNSTRQTTEYVDDDDDIDGVTRVEYYHTTWLDRQLGRASKRRSSKELNERQVKEKAMIEELKRSLKNGAITLRQSFKGKRSANKNKPSETYDDQMLDSSYDSANRVKTKNSSVFGSGLATIPRNYHQKQQQKSSITKSNQKQSLNSHNNVSYSSNSNNNNYNTIATPKPAFAPTSGYSTPSGANEQQSRTQVTRQQEQQATNYSRTLPHNYQARQQTNNPSPGAHQLLQSHYKNDKSFNTIQHTSNSSKTHTTTSDTMRNVHYSTIQPCATSNNNNNRNNYNYNTINSHNNQVKSPIGSYNQQQVENTTISGIPSASEVVRSALSRSNSQISLNQLNKTINLLPNSPPPYANPSPMTPTQQLKAATPSLSPSPTCGTPHQVLQQQRQQHQQYPPSQNQNPYSQQTASPNVASDYASKTWGGPSNSARLQQQEQPQSVYANPHASLMQHKMEQQMTKSTGRNTASIREFNELDSLLRSLSPASTHTTQVTPGYTKLPAQPSFGFGPQPAGGAANSQRQNADIYARVHKQPASTMNPQATNYQAGGLNQQHQQQQHYAPASIIDGGNQNYTINVSDKKDEDCFKRQELSEFEPPVELLPSMEDYQNITKLNPVKNYYWYKPNMSRDLAISLLKDKPQGTFIVRDSTSFKGAYGLAVKVSKLPKNVLNNVNLRNPNADPSAELIRHFLIEPTSNGVRLKGYANEPVFGSLPSLIYQHSLTELALPCKLLIPRADIEDPKFNQKQKQFYQDFLASKEQFKHSPYERTSPNGGYRKYPGDVYVHNEHRIIFE